MSWLTGRRGTAGFASLGGNLIVIGENPDGSGAFRFGLRDPQGDASQYLAIVELGDGETMATTGGYERYFEQDGVRYHHVIDPKTGYPAQRRSAQCHRHHSGWRSWGLSLHHPLHRGEGGRPGPGTGGGLCPDSGGYRGECLLLPVPRRPVRAPRRGGSVRYFVIE